MILGSCFDAKGSVTSRPGTPFVPSFRFFKARFTMNTFERCNTKENSQSEMLLADHCIAPCSFYFSYHA